MPFVDNLRLSVIILVVCVHSAIAYSGVGSWYYKEDLTLGPAAKLGFVCFQAFCQSFFMGALFALAGYFAAQALERKGPREFARGRAVRLGLPALLYMLALQPVTVWMANSRGVRDRMDFPEFLGRYLGEGWVLSGTGPMWFAVALLLFCLAYAGLAACRKPRQDGEAPARAPRPFTWRIILGLALACSASTFLMRLVQPIGTSVLNMQMCFFPQYLILFPLGIAARANGWLTAITARQGRACLAAALAGLPFLAALLASTGAAGDLSPILGGWNGASLAYAVWEQCTGVAMTVGLLWLFREKWNEQGTLARALSDGAFAVYVFHPPIVVGLALILAPLPWAAWPKFLLLAALALPASFGAARLLRRVPVLGGLLTA
jgi:hypothetical protein